jgi:hypothetical protein
MAAKKSLKVSRRIVSRAQQVLAFAEQRAREAANWLELSNALFGPDGEATLAFSTQADRTAFAKTREYKRILALMDTLPPPAVTPEVVEMVSTANGAISVRLPRSVHAALLVEAKAEGVSLNQLCVAKLVAQLRAVV